MNKIHLSISILASFLAVVISVPCPLEAQANWELDQVITDNLTASVHFSTLGYTGFILGTEIQYQPTGEGEVINSDLSEFEGFPRELDNITAAAIWDEENIILFNNDICTFLQLDGLDAYFSEAQIFPDLPENWGGRIDAAVNWGGDHIALFAANQYVFYDVNTETMSDVSLVDEWEGWPSSWTHGIDAASYLMDDNLFFFRNGQVLTYSLTEQAFSRPVSIKASSRISPANRNTPLFGPPRRKSSSGTTASSSGGNSHSSNSLGGSFNDHSTHGGSNENTHSAETPFESGTEEYLDDYVDHTAELANDASDWTAQPLPGKDWLGAGFDILRFDPLKPNELKNRKRFRTVLITNSPDRAGNHSQYLKPYGVFFGSANSGSVVDSSSWITNYRHFSNSFSVGISGSVSVPKAGSSSLSGSFTQMNSTSIGSESIYMITKSQRKIHEVSLRLTWKNKNTGQNYRQKLDPTFVKDVSQLTLPRTLPSNLANFHITQKGQKLPRELMAIKSKYIMFLNKYGTHYAKTVTWGGQYISRTQIKRADFEKSRMTEAGFKQSAEVQIKKAKVGRTIDFKYSDSEMNSNAKRIFRRELYIQGGNGEDDPDLWRNKVDLNPAPVEMEFEPICDLFIPPFFPDDPNLDTKKEILRIITEHYLYDTYREPRESKGDFFRALPDLEMPSVVMVKNGGGYVMWFKVKYEYQGKWVEKVSDNFTLGFAESIEIPVGARNLTIQAKHTFGDIFTKTYDTPKTVCFKCWGTVFDAPFRECE